MGRILLGDRIVKGIITADGLTVDGEYTLPSIDGSSGQVMTTDGSGVLSFTTINAGPTSLDDLSDVISISPISDGDVLTYVGSPGVWIPQAQNTAKRSWTWSAASKNTSTNIYLKGGDGTFTNTSPYIVPFDCKLTAISASTESLYTWNAEVHVNGVNVGALSIFSSDSGYASPLNITINAGDKISFYCNGTSIKGPNITAWFSEI